MKGRLFLVPVTLGSNDYGFVIPVKVISTVRSLRKFVVEDIRSARRFLRMIDTEFPIDECEFMVLNKYTVPEEFFKMLSYLTDGSDIGLMSEAGIPGVADPGSDLVFHAHKNDIRVIPLTGPSSIFLALMASGLNGQNFAFNGYLPINKSDRIKEIKRLEKQVTRGQTQVFMETPYRNMKLLSDLAVTLGQEIYLCIAANISMQDEVIVTKPISNWKKDGFPDIYKKPAIFIIGKKPE